MRTFCHKVLFDTLVTVPVRSPAARLHLRRKIFGVASLLRGCATGHGSRYQAGKLSGADKELRRYGKPPAYRSVGPLSGRRCVRS